MMDQEIIDLIVHLDSSIITGTFSLTRGRLSDFLNSSVKFITLTEASIIKPDGRIEKVKEIYINKETIKLLVTVFNDAGRGYGADKQARRFPFTRKVPVPAKILLAGYELNGNVHCKNDSAIPQLLEQDFMFLPCTDLKIRNTENNVSWEAYFGAVNRTKLNMLQQVALPH
ncbi:MAG: hypothetical protein JW967_09050 [Dehalococcoidales bacterium]|nr:hypothetical protein [Dehalococcoidales bacterium]